MTTIDVGDPRLPERFWDKVQVVAEASAYPGPCWVWTGNINERGYGAFWLNGKDRRAHRVSYEALVGPIPEARFNDHRCRVRCCVNPAHLEPVTTQVNLMRGETLAAANAAKTHCPQGHEYTPENTYLNKRRNIRNCRICARAQWKKWDQNRRAGQ